MKTYGRVISIKNGCDDTTEYDRVISIKNGWDDTTEYDRIISIKNGCQTKYVCVTTTTFDCVQL